METITKEYKVYTIDELSKEAKEKARQAFYEDDNFDFLLDDMYYKLDELLKENKITYNDTPKIYYSLSYCQGDGAMFEGTFFWKKYVINIKQSGHYYHYNSKEIDIMDEDTGDINNKDDKKFNDIYVSICKQMEKYGYDCIETYQSEENFIDMCKANDYNFLESGKMVNY